MSVWRMEMDISFDSKANMLAMMNLIESLYYRLQKKEEPLAIPCSVRWHECMHQEGQPCGGYEIVKFDGVTDHGVPAMNAVPSSVKATITNPIELEKVALQEQVTALTAENVELKKPVIVPEATGAIEPVGE